MLKRRSEKQNLDKFEPRKNLRERNRETVKDYAKDDSSEGYSLTSEKRVSTRNRELRMRRSNWSKNQEAKKKNFSGEKEDRGPRKMIQTKIEEVHLSEISLKKAVGMFKDDTTKYREFKKIRYRREMYSLGDSIFLSNEEDRDNDYLGVIKKIIRIVHNEFYQVIIQIQWYYKRSDLPEKKFGKNLDVISENEIFLTQHMDYVLVDTINGKFKLLSFEAYEAQSRIQNNTYYSRATYDIVKQKFEPPMEKWPKHCICMRPFNPDSLYIQCEKCLKWFHITCVKIPAEKVDSIGTWVCIGCK